LRERLRRPANELDVAAREKWTKEEKKENGKDSKVPDRQEKFWRSCDEDLKETTAHRFLLTISHDTHLLLCLH
jgi:hypothetical protein